MNTYNVTEQDLQQALDNINKCTYAGNITWTREPERVSRNCIRFTLKVKDSNGAGARRGFTGRRMVSACWHVHGDFFDALFLANPDAVIYAGGKKITKDAGNWVDRNIGSIVEPLYFSEACECNR